MSIQPPTHPTQPVVLSAKSRIHLVGIGGAGLSAIARVLIERGHTVSGSDANPGQTAVDLTALGAVIYRGHAAEHIAGADLLICSSAVPESNPEVQAALAASIPVYKRRDFLTQLLAEQRTIAVAGAHGKTTTTALIAWLLTKTHHDPGYIVGSRVNELNSNAHHGLGNYFVIEADEYDYMFLGLQPQIAVVTNIEHDHPDMFPTYADMQAAFAQFSANRAEGGLLLACADDPGARELAAQASAPVANYGLHTSADWQATNLHPNPKLGGSDFTVMHKGQSQGTASIALPGEHNVANALAAIAVCYQVGLTLNDLKPALRSFTGTGRRFELLGEVVGIAIIDDYAHHPTEVRATLAGARARYGSRPIWAMFQPHTFSRTRTLLTDFAHSFADADHVLVADIYRAREQDDGSIHAQAVLANMPNHADARYVGPLEQAIAVLTAELQPGDVLITLGAGDSHTVAEQVLANLRERHNA